MNRRSPVLALLASIASLGMHAAEGDELLRGSSEVPKGLGRPRRWAEPPQDSIFESGMSSALSPADEARKTAAEAKRERKRAKRLGLAIRPPTGGAPLQQTVSQGVLADEDVAPDCPPGDGAA